MSGKKDLVITGLGYGVVIIIVAVFFFPTLFIILTSFKKTVDAFSVPPKWIFQPTLLHHITVWLKEPFFHYLVNSLIIALGSVAFSVPTATLAAYYLARHSSKESRTILLSMLTMRMLPRMVLVIPFFLIARKYGLYDTHLIVILILSAINQPFSTWLMRGFFLEIPSSLDEAAVIDGCSKLGAFWRVVLPVVKPGLVTTTLFCFLFAYNEFLFPLVLTGIFAKPLTVAVSEYSAELIQYWSISSAGVTAIIIPSIIFMTLIQKHLVKGLTFGAIRE